MWGLTPPLRCMLAKLPYFSAANDPDADKLHLNQVQPWCVLLGSGNTGIWSEWAEIGGSGSGGRFGRFVDSGKKMPAILVASAMKSGLPKPKPVHSALPIPQTPSRPSALALPSAPLKSRQVSTRPSRSSPESEAAGNPQVCQHHPHLLRLTHSTLSVLSHFVWSWFVISNFTKIRNAYKMLSPWQILLEILNCPRCYWINDNDYKW